MSVKTVKVSNVSLGASQRDVKEFFSFSGDIEYVEMQSDTARSQIAYVTFKYVQGAETAVLLSLVRCIMGKGVGKFCILPASKHITPYSSSIQGLGATIVDLSVIATLAPEYRLPPATEDKAPAGADSAFRKAEDVVSWMLAKGFIVGKNAVNKAKTFDEKHQLTSTASAKVASFDKKIGLTDKITVGANVMSNKVHEVDQKFQVSGKAKSAFAAAEEKVSSAGSTVMKNRFVLTGASWVTGAFNKVVKAAGNVGQKTKEKVGKAEDEQRRKMVDNFAQVHLSESPKASETNEHQHFKSTEA